MLAQTVHLKGQFAALITDDHRHAGVGEVLDAFSGYNFQELYKWVFYGELSQNLIKQQTLLNIILVEA